MTLFFLMGSYPQDCILTVILSLIVYRKLNTVGGEVCKKKENRYSIVKGASRGLGHRHSERMPP